MKLTAWWSDQEMLVRLGRTLIKMRSLIGICCAVLMALAGLRMSAVGVVLILVGPHFLGLRYKALGKRIRPRFGQFISEDGEQTPIVFYPHPDDPETFCAYHAGDESPVDPGRGCRVVVDSMRDGQSIAFGVPREDIR